MLELYENYDCHATAVAIRLAIRCCWVENQDYLSRILLHTFHGYLWWIPLVHFGGIPTSMCFMTVNHWHCAEAMFGAQIFLRLLWLVENLCHLGHVCLLWLGLSQGSQIVHMRLQRICTSLQHCEAPSKHLLVHGLSVSVSCSLETGKILGDTFSASRRGPGFVCGACNLLVICHALSCLILIVCRVLSGARKLYFSAQVGFQRTLVRALGCAMLQCCNISISFSIFGGSNRLHLSL